MIEIPAAFAEQIVAREGDAGAAWIVRLPDLLGQLLDLWGLAVSGRPMHGLIALVVPVRARRPPADYVLKISFPDDETRHEALALRHWNGHGAVLAQAVDDTRRALLLERLDPDRTLEHLPLGSALDVAAALLRRLHRPPPDGLPTTAALAAHWHHDLPHRWNQLQRPGDRALIDTAAELCVDLARDSAPPVLLHGDFHYANVLAGSRSPWNAIDPKPLAGPAEYDLLPLVRNRWDLTADSTQATRRLHHLVHATDLDFPRARQWAMVRSIDDALWGHAHQEPAFTRIAWHIAHTLRH